MSSHDHDHTHAHGHEHGHGGDCCEGGGNDCCNDKKADCCDGGGCCGGDAVEVVHDHGHGHGGGGGLPVHISFWSGWGYARFASALTSFLQDEFGSKLSISSERHPGGLSGAFEVTAGGELIHSKMTMPGCGKVQTDEELDKIIEKINAKLA
jgi:selT/selW/selH-like putative selenoprotein